MWKQLIGHAKEQKMEYIIFITDDRKEDWWWKEECQGPKTIGPRPELVEEIIRESGARVFYAYNSERFLEYSENQLSVTIEPTSLEQIREFSKPRLNYDSPFFTGSYELDAVHDWIQKRYPNDQIVQNQSLGPDLIVNTTNGEKIGYEVKILRSGSSISNFNSLKGWPSYKRHLALARMYLVLISKDEQFEKNLFKNNAYSLLEAGFDGVYMGK